MPNPLHPPSGCPFQLRCPKAIARCTTDVPAFKPVADNHWAACHLNETPE